VGACNTVFGYGCFALFTMWLNPIIAYGYVLASLSPICSAITFAFLDISGLYSRQGQLPSKNGSVASASMRSSMMLSTPPSVRCRHHPPPTPAGQPHSAPYIAGAIVLVISVVFSFFGHRHISFADGNPPTAAR
jgi:hypothetical protein